MSRINDVTKKELLELSDSIPVGAAYSNMAYRVTGQDIKDFVMRFLNALLGAKVDKTTKVNGHALSGDVSVTKADVGLGNVDDTSDLNKPISTATQTALNTKQNIITDLETIRSGASKGATAVQPEVGKGLFSGSYNDLRDKPSIPSITGLETSEHAAATYQPKGNYQNALGLYVDEDGDICQN